MDECINKICPIYNTEYENNCSGIDGVETCQTKTPLKASKECEKEVMEAVVAIATPSLDPERFEALTEALTQVAKNRGIQY